jgi:hypothetical protein
MNKNIPLSTDIKSVILGSLLGDGSLKVHQKYANARFSFRHSVKQKDYFFWKAHALKKEIAGNKYFWYQGKDGRDGWGGEKIRFQSLALPALTELYALTHPHKGTFQIRRKWLNLLTPLSLAIWWQDDGSIIANGRKGVLCTDGFKPEEVELLAQYLEKVWHVHLVASPKSKSNPNQYRLWFRSTDELKSFLRIILPFVKTEDMLQKCMLLYKDPKLQQRWISEIAGASSFSLEKIQGAYAAKRAKWKTYARSENDIVQSL